MKNVNVLPNIDVSWLDKEILDENGLLKIMPASFYRAIEQNVLAIWGHHHAVYCFPTEELIDFLRKEIGLRVAIEIGAGNGAIGRALGIPATDSYIQKHPSVLAQYKMMGQPAIDYPNDVQNLEAMDAIRFFKPEIVLGAWITQKYRPGMTAASVYGVDERRILNLVSKYIVIGNEATHGDKEILRYKPRVIRDFDREWLFSRSMDPRNLIYIWGEK